MLFAIKSLDDILVAEQNTMENSFSFCRKRNSLQLSNILRTKIISNFLRDKQSFDSCPIYLFFLTFHPRPHCTSIFPVTFAYHYSFIGFKTNNQCYIFYEIFPTCACARARARVCVCIYM